MDKKNFKTSYNNVLSVRYIISNKKNTYVLILKNVYNNNNIILILLKCNAIVYFHWRTIQYNFMF